MNRVPISPTSAGLLRLPPAPVQMAATWAKRKKLQARNFVAHTSVWPLAPIWTPRELVRDVSLTQPRLSLCLRDSSLEWQICSLCPIPVSGPWYPSSRFPGAHASTYAWVCHLLSSGPAAPCQHLGSPGLCPLLVPGPPAPLLSTSPVTCSRGPGRWPIGHQAFPVLGPEPPGLTRWELGSKMPQCRQPCTKGFLPYTKFPLKISSLASPRSHVQKKLKVLRHLVHLPMHGRGAKIFGKDIKKNLMYVYTFPPKKTLKGYKNGQLTLNNGTVSSEA